MIAAVIILLALSLLVATESDPVNTPAPTRPPSRSPARTSANKACLPRKLMRAFSQSS